MNARDVREYLKTMDGGWVNWENTVDTFKSGDPTTEVRGIAVGWMGYTWTLQRALELDCNMFITHEPTYYNHHDTDQNVFRYQGVAAKRKMIEEPGHVINSSGSVAHPFVIYLHIVGELLARSLNTMT